MLTPLETESTHHGIFQYAILFIFNSGKFSSIAYMFILFTLFLLSGIFRTILNRCRPPSRHSLNVCLFLFNVFFNLFVVQ